MLKHNIVNRITRQVRVELPSEAYKLLIWKILLFKIFSQRRAFYGLYEGG